MSPRHKQLLGSDLRVVQDCCCPVHLLLEAPEVPVAPPPAPGLRQARLGLSSPFPEDQLMLAPAMFFKNTFELGQKSRGGKVLFLAFWILFGSNC